MKILFVGSLGAGQTTRMRMRALQRLGHDVVGVDTVMPWRNTPWLQRQFGRRLERGPVVDRINRIVLDSAGQFAPDLVWSEKMEFMRADTLRALRKGGAKLLHFTPDPYFSLAWKRTHLIDEAIGEFDALLYCKNYERAAYEALHKPLVYMPLGFCEEVHRPLKPGNPRWASAVSFLGGWEPRRAKLLGAIIGMGVDVKIWGSYWEFLADGNWSLRRYIILRQLAGSERFHFQRDERIACSYQGDEIYADDYARALTGAKIGLGFLRTICPDQHTTRSFEIPACRSMLIADRTAEHQAFFDEGKEAEFFSCEDELRDKVKFYCAHDEARSRIADAGYRRCLTAGYSYSSRLRSALSAVADLL